MALDATVGGAASDTYATLAEAETYVSSQYLNPTVKSNWDGLADLAKESLLKRATQLLDRHVVWLGEIFGDVQALSWPRACATDRHGRDVESTVVPAFVKEFQIEVALWVMTQAGITPETGNAEFDSIKVGALEIDFNQEGGARKFMLPEAVISAIRPMGRYSAQLSGGATSVRLLRT